jgi:polyhydroxybutyrate depolymerase
LWANANRCKPLPDRRKLRGDSVEVTSWMDCSEGTTVDFYSLKGWGHQWPGPFFTGRLDRQDPLHGFDAAGIIWHFFTKYSR